MSRPEILKDCPRVVNWAVGRYTDFELHYSFFFFSAEKSLHIMRHYLVNKNSKESLIRLGGVSIKPPRSLRYNICNYSNPYPPPTLSPPATQTENPLS